jgi:hypothetical protein
MVRGTYQYIEMDGLPGPNPVRSREYGPVRTVCGPTLRREADIGRYVPSNVATAAGGGRS